MAPDKPQLLAHFTCLSRFYSASVHLWFVTLLQGVRVGQLFNLSVQQYSGIAAPERALRMRGAFQFNIPVNDDAEILPVPYLSFTPPRLTSSSFQIHLRMK